MATHFDEIAPWPEASPPPARTPAIGDNKPPLDEATIADFMETLRTDNPGIEQRIANLIEKGNAATGCDNEAQAGRMGDFAKACKAVTDAIEAAREKHNRPLLNAQRGLKARADAMASPISAVQLRVRGFVNAYVAEQDRKRREAERERERQAEIARQAVAAEAARVAAAQAAARGADEATAQQAADEAAERAAESVQIAAPASESGPVARGDLGSRVGVKIDWKLEIESVRQLPDSILKSPPVIAAAQKEAAAVLRRMAKDPENPPTIKGCRIWHETGARIS